MDQLQRRQIVVEIPRRSSLEIDPAAIHQRRLRHSWLPRHLEALCLLYRFYDNSPHEFVNVFNKLFENDLQAEGFEKGLNYGRLVSRWNSIKDWDGGHDMWVKISKFLILLVVRDDYSTTFKDRSHSLCQDVRR